VEEQQSEVLQAWMGILALPADERVAIAGFAADAFSVSLRAGRITTLPLAW
jgi:hypothetical protein